MRNSIIGITVGVILCATPAVASTILNFELTLEYSGGTPPAPPGPWLRAIFENTSGGVELRLANLLNGPTEFSSDPGCSTSTRRSIP